MEWEQQEWEDGDPSEEWEDPELFSECSPGEYLFQHLLAGTLILCYWRNYLLGSFYVAGTSLWISRKGAAVLLGALLVLGALLSIPEIRRRENLRYVRAILHEFGMLGIFTVLQFSEGYPAILPATILAVLILLLVRAVWIVRDVGKRLRKRNGYRSPAAEVRGRLCCFCRTWVLRGFCLIGMAVYLLSLMNVLDRSTFWGPGHLETAYAASGDQLIRDRREQLALLEHGWETAELPEKMEVLEQVLDIECSYLGIPDRPALTMEDLNTKTETGIEHEGHFDSSSYEIVISRELLEREDALYCASVICHETLHCWQYFLKDEAGRFPKDDPVYYTFRRLADRYEEELNNYQDGEENFGAYFFQTVEADARRYENFRQNVYLEILSEPLMEER